MDLIDKENWSASGTDLKGDAYEALLSKGASDKGSGAGQYFTPVASSGRSSTSSTPHLPTRSSTRPVVLVASSSSPMNTQCKGPRTSPRRNANTSVTISSLDTNLSTEQRDWPR